MEPDDRVSDNPPPKPPKRAATYSSARPFDPTQTQSALRQRGPQRQSSVQSLNGSLSPPPNLDRRRSSILSYSSFDNAAHSLAGDIFSPGTARTGDEGDLDQVTHWHSTPLAFAILPAVGGLLFKNGSAFVTDVLLLGLAAIFMNWSIRLPWDWYHAAQMQRRVGSGEGLDTMPGLDEDDLAVETGSSGNNSPKHESNGDALPNGEEDPLEHTRKEEAAAELRRLEVLALISTFLFPILAAYLIHIIRGQLSTSSTGLVSDFNLCIFLLAALIRPSRHLIRLITARTLHLQRTVTGLSDPFSPSTSGPSLAARIADLEAKLSAHTLLPPNQAPSFANKNDVNDLFVELRKRYEPRFDALDRAMRRYEKRSTTLALQVDQRLAQIDTVVQDTLSLAAQAARQSQRGYVARMLEGMSRAFMVPLKVLLGVLLWPVKVVEVGWSKVSGLLFDRSGDPAKNRKKGNEKAQLGTIREKEKSKGASPAAAAAPPLAGRRQVR